MLSLTFRFKKKYIIICIIFVFCIAFLLLNNAFSSETISPVTNITSENIPDYIESFGFTVKKESKTVEKVKIPSVFNDVYENYNQIQIAQGFDLNKYKGKDVERFTFELMNTDENLLVNVYLYENTVIAADICSTSINGQISALKQ